MGKFTAEMGNFTPLFDVVIHDVGITGAAVYGRVWRYCQGERGVCQATQDTIADELDVSRHTVLRWLGKLCEAGYLEDTTPDLRNKPHTYRDTGKVEIQVRLDAVAKSDSEGAAVAESNSAVAESNSQCSRESHEERSKREEKREDHDASASVPVGDLDDIEWHSGEKRSRDNGETKRFQQTGDVVVDIVAASDLSKQRGVPDWAMRTEGVHPLFGVVKTFCEMTRQDVGTLREKEARSWLKAFAGLVQDKGVTPGELVEAHRILPQEQWGGWYLDNHKWSSPYADSYADMVVLAARQIRDGTLEPENAWSGAL